MNLKIKTNLNIKVRKYKFLEIIFFIFCMSFLFCDNPTFSVLYNLKAIILIFLISLGYLLFNKAYIKKENIFLLFLFILCIISMALAGKQLYINNAAAYLLMLFSVFIFVMLYNNAISIDFMNKTLMLFGFIESVRLILFGKTDTTIASADRFSIGAIGGSTYYEVNCLCVVLILPALIFVCYALNSKTHKFIYMIGSLVVSVAIFLTGSRNGFVCVIAGIVLLGLNYLRTLPIPFKRKMNYIIGGIIIVIIIAIITYKVLPDDIISRLLHESYYDAGNISRLKHWELALVTIAKNPILGRGVMGSYNAIYSATGYDLVAHNTFLSIYIEYGLLSLLIFLYIIFKGLIVSVKKKQYNFFIISCIILFSYNILELPYLFVFWIYLFYCCIIGLSKNNIFPENI